MQRPAADLSQGGDPWLRVGAGLEMGVMGAEKTVVWGALATTDFRLYRQWRLQIDFEYLRSRAVSVLGPATLDWFGAIAGPDLTLMSVPEIRVGGRLEIAHVNAVGTSALGYHEPSHSAWAMLLLVSGQIRVPLGNGWGLRSVLETGHSLIAPRFTAGGEPIFTLAGYFGSSRAILDREF